MKQQKRLLSIILSLILATQVGFAGVALADDGGGSPSPTPTPSDSPSPDASPSPTPDPSASPTPDPSVSPSPSPDPSPAPKHHKSDDPSSSPAPQTGPTGPTGPQAATGAPSSTGAQGCGGNPPQWVYNTSTQKWESADATTFNCDPTTGYYLSPEYFYNQQDGWYEIIPAAQVANLPSYFITAPNVIHTVLGDLVVGSQTYEAAKAMGLLGDGGIVIGGTGPGSGNSSSLSSGSQNWIDLTNLVNIMNTLQSAAGSGNVAADSNTSVGSSVTGAANVMANLINLLASAWSWSNGNLAFFMKDLGLDGSNANVNIDPSGAATAGGGQLGSGSSSDLNVNAQNQGSIVNNVDLAAASGDASANSNTNAGDVSTGNAQAEINIMNLINSYILSGNSFFGVLNIFNNYSGNVVFPDGFLNGLLSSGSSATGDPANNATQSDATNSQANTVNNNITTTADSGAATGADNTQVGALSTGSATTTQNTFNLANTSIFGDNAVLVIVNVLGHWVGKIMNLPGGTTESALLTDNAQVTPDTAGTNASIGTTGPQSNNQIGADNSSTANVNQSSTGSITNNVNVGAKSGDASATDNTQVGNVDTGNASAASSVTNIFNSVLNVKHWFGVLVINVFGDWLGSVGDPTSLGLNGMGGGSNPAPQTAGVQTAAATMPQLGVLGLFNSGGSGSASGNTAGASTQVTSGTGKVLTAAAEQPAPENAKEVANSRDMSILFVLSAIVMLMAGALTSIDRKLKRAK